MFVIKIFQENKEFLSECFQVLHLSKVDTTDIEIAQQGPTLLAEWVQYLKKMSFGISPKEIQSYKLLMSYNKFINELEKTMLALSTVNLFQSSREATMQIKRSLAKVVKKRLQDHGYEWEDKIESLKNFFETLDSGSALEKYLISSCDQITKFNQNYVEWYQKKYQKKAVMFEKPLLSGFNVIVHKAGKDSKQTVKQANEYINRIKARREELDHASLEELKSYISIVEVENLFEKAVLHKEICFNDPQQGRFFYTLYDELSEDLFHKPLSETRKVLEKYVKRYRKEYSEPTIGSYIIMDDDNEHITHPEWLSFVYAQARLEYVLFQKKVSECETFADLRKYCLSLSDKFVVGDNLVAKQVKPILQTLQTGTDVQNMQLPSIIKDKIKTWQESGKFLYHYKSQQQVADCYACACLVTKATTDVLKNKLG